MSEWRPIETAPKDGRTILLAMPVGDGLGVGYWMEEANEWVPAAPIIVLTVFMTQPTHWMPLPEPPEADER